MTVVLVKLSGLPYGNPLAFSLAISHNSVMIATDYEDVPVVACFLAGLGIPAAAEYVRQSPRSDCIILDPLTKEAAGPPRGKSVSPPSGYSVVPDPVQLATPVLIQPDEKPAVGMFEPVTRSLGLSDSWLARRLDGPNPLSAALAGGLVSGGLGYLSGAAIENLLPGVIEKNRLRKNLALLGAGLGILPAAYLASVNYREDPDKGFWSAWRRPNPIFGKQSAIMRVFQKTADAGGIGPLPQIPVDAFNRVVMADPFTPPALRQATVALTRTVDLASGGTGLITPYDLTRIGIGMGAGYAQAYIGGRILGTLAGLSPSAQSTLQRTGAFAGALKSAVPGLFGVP